MINLKRCKNSSAKQVLEYHGKKITQNYDILHLGDVWHTDEIYFTVNGSGRLLFGVMNASTRFITSYDISDTKFGYDATLLFKKATEYADKYPDMLISDGLGGFKTGYKKAMYTRTKPRTTHVADVGIRNRCP